MTKAQVIKNVNSSTDWFPKSYAGYLFGIHIQAMGVSNASKKFAFAQRFGIVNINPRKAHWDWFWNTSSMKKSREMIIKLAGKNGKFAESFFSEWRKRYEAYIRQFEKIVAASPENFDDKTTLKEFRKL